jgi:hypothetical protein
VFYCVYLDARSQARPAIAHACLLLHASVLALACLHARCSAHAHARNHATPQVTHDARGRKQGGSILSRYGALCDGAAMQHEDTFAEVRLHSGLHSGLDSGSCDGVLMRPRNARCTGAT